MRQRRLDLWLPSYVRGFAARRRLRARRQQQLTHVLFFVCDHYEPRHAARNPDQPAARVRAWHEGYRELQRECEERYGLRPQHTFFYPPHHGPEHLPALARMAFDGLGEIELHYHHSGDTEDSLRADLKKTLADFRRAGLLLQAGDPPVRRFGFIHGDWALDNSADGEYCGVDSEISLLQELGCWGDLTMPSANRCQTRKINSIYYAVDDPHKPKSHDTGADARVNAPKQPGLLMIQGPLALNVGAPRYPRVENASLTTYNWGRPDRIRSWLNCHVHVQGRPEWLFVKLHTHGAIEGDFDGLFGKRARMMHKMLAEQLNDGKNYRLHYVTARQAFNVVRAAENGLGGEPSQYFDYELGPQATSFYCLDAAHELQSCTREKVILRDIAPVERATLRLRQGPEEISGKLASVAMEPGQRMARFELHGGSGEAQVRLNGAAIAQLTGGEVVRTEGKLVSLRCNGPVTVRFEEAR